jgi:hypothetical protein
VRLSRFGWRALQLMREVVRRPAALRAGCHMIRYSWLTSLFVSVVLGSGCSDDVSAPPRPSAIVLAPPALISPPDSAVFSTFPRTTTYVWHTVSGASAYSIEIDCYHCCVAYKWCTDAGTDVARPPRADTAWTEDFVGAQPGRWRVTGVDSLGLRGPKSAWRYFTHTQ